MARYFFLDFDGVVCDSIPECFVSSCKAYRELILGETINAVPLRDRNLFYAYRPFIRSGEDYPLIQDMIRRGVSADSQEVFDAEIIRAGGEKMNNYGRLFYQAREEFLAQDRGYWLDLNPLFPGMADILPKVADNENFYILSTKKPPFIREILSHHGINWDIERVLYPGEKTKKEVIESVAGPGGEAVFVDDQLDHLLIASANKNIICRLANWGYVKKAWLEQKNIPVIGPGDLARLVSPFFTFV
ncbi:MAG: HAD family hydrolase [Spirochaetales bacterium]|jgi:phosphoglycolate phosphatase-like HAD superfamily hydrolase|nr:HAD family hydrolase [Spirochaetales bacterium]